MSEKLNITPGMWATNAQSSFIYGNTEKNEPIVEDLICEPPFDEEGYPRWKDNATAIVTAVNNTYHKGINPDAVPEMLEALKYAVENFASAPFETSERLESIIQKATL